MDQYDEEMFEFLTRKENFESMTKVVEQYDVVVNKLIVDFWDLVVQHIKQDKRVATWKVDKSDDYFERYGSVWLYKENWAEGHCEELPLCVSWESVATTPYYGVWLNADSDLWDAEAMKNYISNLKQSESGRIKNPYWGFRVEPKTNFSHSKELKRILPNMRDGLVEEYSNLLIETAVEFEPHMEKAFQMKRKK